MCEFSTDPVAVDPETGADRSVRGWEAEGRCARCHGSQLEPVAAESRDKILAWLKANALIEDATRPASSGALILQAV